MAFTIFLSHVTEDREVAVRLKDEIERSFLKAVQVFVSSDQRSLPGGTEWFEKVKKELTACGLVIVLVSSASLRRPWVNFEAGAGWMRGVPVLPTVCRGMTLAELPQPLSFFQARSLSEPRDVEELFRDIAQHAGMDCPPIDAGKLAGDFADFAVVDGAETTPDRPEQPGDPPGSLLPALAEESTVFFWKRMCNAFPGIRGVRWFDDPLEAMKRLEILLADPLLFMSHGRASSEPIWWFRGHSNLYIDRFRHLSGSLCVMGWYEVVLRRIAVYRSADYYREFVYVETEAQDPIGLYQYRQQYREGAAANGKHLTEEYALVGDRPITRAEYDDGAAVIDGQVVNVPEAQPRVRRLTPYNLLIAAKFAPLNNPSMRVDSKVEGFLDGLLEGKRQLEELIAELDSLPRNPLD